jgi:hypothetical protein
MCGPKVTIYSKCFRYEKEKPISIERCVRALEANRSCQDASGISAIKLSAHRCTVSYPIQGTSTKSCANVDVFRKTCRIEDDKIARKAKEDKIKEDKVKDTARAKANQVKVNKAKAARAKAKPVQGR